MTRKMRKVSFAHKMEIATTLKRWAGEEDDPHIKADSWADLTRDVAAEVGMPLHDLPESTVRTIANEIGIKIVFKNRKGGTAAVLAEEIGALHERVTKQDEVIGRLMTRMSRLEAIAKAADARTAKSFKEAFSNAR